MQIDWSKITLGTFNKIESITSAELSDEEKTNRLIEVIFGVKAETLSIKDYLKKVKELAFLQEKIVPARVKSKYKIGSPPMGNWSSYAQSLHKGLYGIDNR